MDLETKTDLLSPGLVVWSGLTFTDWLGIFFIAVDVKDIISKQPSKKSRVRGKKKCRKEMKKADKFIKIKPSSNPFHPIVLSICSYSSHASVLTYLGVYPPIHLLRNQVNDII